MHLAARCGQADALKALLEDLDEEERVAFLNDADKNGITPVFLAKQKGGHLAQLPLLGFMSLQCRRLQGPLASR